MESVSEKKLQHQSLTPKKMDIHYLKTITKDFSEDQILGRGGYGIVYKGVQQNGEVVAVKKLIMNMAGVDDKQFMNEVQHTLDICHPNIVRLEGYCYQTEKELTSYNGYYIFVDEVYRLLCFEYLPNGSLDKYLSGMMILCSNIIVFLPRILLSLPFFIDESAGLDWRTRYNIIEGICNGLYCLHEGKVGAPILHLDLKPSNILLDKNMTPKIADFGLSRLFDEGKTHTCTTNVIGSRGYMAPEYIDRFILSKESDIFSLGVIIMEIVVGHRKYPEGTSEEEFIEVYEKWRVRLQKRANKTSLEEKCRQVDQCIRVGLKCMEQNPKRRPNIREIVEILKRTQCSVREEGSEGEEQCGKLERQEWCEIINIIVSGSADQSMEALETICVELNKWIDDTFCILPESNIPEYILEDADRLVSCLTLMVQKTFSSNIYGSSFRHRKYPVDTLILVVRIKHLVHAVKKVTLQALVMGMLIWIVKLDEEVVKMDDSSQLLNSLDVSVVKILEENADRMPLFVILTNLLRPLDPSEFPSCTPLELLVVKNNTTRFSKLVCNYIFSFEEFHLPEGAINDLDLDLILQSIHAILEPLGMEEVDIRYENFDVLVNVVFNILEELVFIMGSKLKDHLSMVLIDVEHVPTILRVIDELIRYASPPAFHFGTVWPEM